MSRGPCVYFYIGKYKRGEYTLTVQRAHKQFEIGSADEYKRREFTTTETVVVLDNKKKIREISSNRASHELRFLLLLRIFSRFRRLSGEKAKSPTRVHPSILNRFALYSRRWVCLAEILNSSPQGNYKISLKFEKVLSRAAIEFIL